MLDRFLVWWLNKVVKILEWRTRNYTAPPLSEWEQTRQEARLNAATRAWEDGDWRKVFRYINKG